MPVDRKRYPKNWRDISQRIRERDEWKCKKCGIADGAINPRTGKRVTLTVAHLDDPDPMHCDDSNLAALCNSCHNRLDAPMRARHAKITRHRKRRAKILATGQQELIPEES